MNVAERNRIFIIEVSQKAQKNKPDDTRKFIFVILSFHVELLTFFKVAIFILFYL